jgi:uncharacterized protein
MTIVDANLLLYAYNADAPQHSAAVRWLTGLFERGGMIALPWVTLWAFLRICTNPRIWSSPLPSKEAFAIVDEWLVQPDVVLLQPGPRHWELLQGLIVDGNATGPLMTDAVLAALAIENGALLASTDRDFARFKGLRWVDPLGE